MIHFAYSTPMVCIIQWKINILLQSKLKYLWVLRLNEKFYQEYVLNKGYLKKSDWQYQIIVSTTYFSSGSDWWTISTCLLSFYSKCTDHMHDYTVSDKGSDLNGPIGYILSQICFERDVFLKNILYCHSSNFTDHVHDYTGVKTVNSWHQKVKRNLSLEFCELKRSCIITWLLTFWQ